MAWFNPTDYTDSSCTPDDDDPFTDCVVCGHEETVDNAGDCRWCLENPPEDEDDDDDLEEDDDVSVLVSSVSLGLQHKSSLDGV